MNRAILIAGLLVALGGPAAATGGCPDISPLDIHPCSTCTANNFVGDTLCAYCSATRSCNPVPAGDLLAGNAPCGKDSANKALPFSLGIGGECDCWANADTNTGDCASCANSGNPGCVWVEAGRQIISGRARNPITGAMVQFPAVQLWKNGTCQSTTKLQPLEVYTVTNANGATWLEVSIVDDNMKWFWQQCTLPGASFIVVVVSSVMVSIALVCGCCTMLMRRRRRAMQKSQAATIDLSSSAGTATKSPWQFSQPSTYSVPAAAVATGEVVLVAPPQRA